MQETIFQKIIRRTGRKPVECKCQACKKQCRTPCLGTPDDIMRLIEAGYIEQLMKTEWCVGQFLGKINHSITMVQLKKEENGFCVLYKDGLCGLHSVGLKPTEGRLSHHSIKPENYSFRKSLSYNVAKEWEDPGNLAQVIKIFALILVRDV